MSVQVHMFMCVQRLEKTVRCPLCHPSSYSFETESLPELEPSHSPCLYPTQCLGYRSMWLCLPLYMETWGFQLTAHSLYSKHSCFLNLLLKCQMSFLLKIMSSLSRLELMRYSFGTAWLLGHLPAHRLHHRSNVPLLTRYINMTYVSWEL